MDAHGNKKDRPICNRKLHPLKIGVNMEQLKTE
jgi:hypothetical protein